MIFQVNLIEPKNKNQLFVFSTRSTSNRKFRQENTISVISLLLLVAFIFHRLNIKSVCKFSRTTNIFTRKKRLKRFILIVLSSFIRFLASTRHSNIIENILFCARPTSHGIITPKIYRIEYYYGFLVHYLTYVCVFVFVKENYDKMHSSTYQ